MFTFHQATQDDADAIAAIVIAANGGLVEQLLDGLIPGLKSATILSATFIKGEGPYRTENVICARENERLTCMLFAYPASEHCVPPLLESFIPAKRLNPIRPVLETSVPGSLYINTLWREPALRGTGHTAALVLEAESLCRAGGFDRLSVFCWNDNDEDMAIWTQQGFCLAERIELAHVGAHTQGGSLLCKVLGEA